MKFKMVSLFWIIGLFCFSLNGNSQEKKLSRQELKEVRKARMEANFMVLDSLLNTRNFILEADFLQNQYGYRIFVNPTLNFVKVNDTNGILQTGSNVSMGYNGVGGVTAEGTIGKWEVSKDPERLTFTLRFNLLTNIGYYDVFMTIASDASASATISGLRRGRLTWEGNLNTLENSRVFEGQRTI